jgi:HTH-type transcriptional regulator, sugar sensing transcriptional regulator
MLTQTSESDLIDRLVRHGLGQGEARCYVGMLAPRAFRVSEVAVEAGLPRSRAYELIRSLVRFGLCTEVAGGGVARFRAVPPNEAIGRLEASLAEQTRRRDLALNGLLQALNGREDPRADREPVDMLRRHDQIIGGIAEAIAGADHEVLTIMNVLWVPTTCQTIRDRVDAGVGFRAVLDRPCLDSDPHREWVAEYADAPGFEARVVDRLDVMFTLVDRHITFLNLVIPEIDVPGSHVESLRIRHVGLGQTFHDAFERLWQRGVAFGRALEGDDGPAPAGVTTNPRDRGVPPARGSNGRSAGHD